MVVRQGKGQWYGWGRGKGHRSEASFHDSPFQVPKPLGTGTEGRGLGAQHCRSSSGRGCSQVPWPSPSTPWISPRQVSGKIRSATMVPTYKYLNRIRRKKFPWWRNKKHSLAKTQVMWRQNWPNGFSSTVSDAAIAKRAGQSKGRCCLKNKWNESSGRLVLTDQSVWTLRMQFWGEDGYREFLSECMYFLTLTLKSYILVQKTRKTENHSEQNSLIILWLSDNHN